jgi:outer membrane protein assembly factor BamB
MLLQTTKHLLLLMALVVSWQTLALAENWPGWRGPRGDGTSLDDRIPTHWNEETGKNIRWKVPLPGQGYSSPIIWEDSIFLTSCLDDNLQRVLLKLDRRTGRLLWQKTVLSSPLETKHKLNSFASGTPVTDGRLVYVAFLEVDGSTIEAPNVGNPRDVTPGTMVVAAYDFDGNQKWIVRPGPFISVHGFCSCPVLYEDLVIINGDHDGDSYVVALNRETGQTVWKTPRQHKTRSYVTPLIRTMGGRTQLVLSGSKSVTGLNPLTGETYWTIDGPTEQFVASMVDDGQQFYLAAGYPTYHVMAVKPDGVGNVTDTHVSWHVTTAKCYVPSPVLIGPYLLVADDHGILNCFETSTGERLWRERLGRHFSASLLAANGLAYVLADDGKMTVLSPGPTATIIAENQLSEDFYASPAVSQGEIFLRGTGHLYCLSSQ